MEEFMNDKTEELEQLLSERRVERTKPLDDSKSEKSILFLAGACILLVIAVIVVYFGRGGGDFTEESVRIQAKLDELEDRLGQISGLGDRIESLEKQEKSVQQNMAKTERAVNSITEHLDILTKEFDRMQKKTEEMASVKVAKPEPSPPPAQPAPVPRSESEAVYHDVSPGDTLYGISRKYDITVDELRRLNNLSKGQSIQPGQKLVVKPAGPD